MRRFGSRRRRWRSSSYRAPRSSRPGRRVGGVFFPLVRTDRGPWSVRTGAGSPRPPTAETNGSSLVQQVGKGRIASAFSRPDWVRAAGLGVVGHADGGGGLEDRASGSTSVAHLRDAGGRDSGSIADRSMRPAGSSIRLPLVADQLLWEFEYNGWTSLHRISIQELLDFNTLHRTSPDRSRSPRARDGQRPDGHGDGDRSRGASPGPPCGATGTATG